MTKGLIDVNQASKLEVYRYLSSVRKLLKVFRVAKTNNLPHFKKLKKWKNNFLFSELTENDFVEQLFATNARLSYHVVQALKVKTIDILRLY